ncbi:class I SAM-dependent methyltransferase [Luteimonas fraxinea]|uniref:class I SAM-dependent methyltransferase n=1 Tax=Luteimonas fraxinea TaxID=2901869 RepID=UPI001E2AB595|nr:class I SAM-dependent methyltransferase [Luteimonas fraxinea]MCD9124377.1 class I SAM-dependent methyltransferase [Luteimonas fraxinea]
MSSGARAPHAVQDLPSRRWKGEKILRMLALGPRDLPWRVLEVGTGSGGIANFLGTHPKVACDVTSVDVVDVRSIRDGYTYRRVAGTELPFEDATFDVVITNHVIEHVGDRCQQRAHLDECARVLAGDGRGYLAVPNRWMLVEPHYRLAFLSWLPRRLRSPYLRLMGRGSHYDCEPLSQTEIETLLVEAGLEYRNICIPALRATIEIEPGGGVARYVFDKVPNALLRLFASWIPTLIYRFSR